MTPEKREEYANWMPVQGEAGGLLPGMNSLTAFPARPYESWWTRGRRFIDPHTGLPNRGRPSSGALSIAPSPGLGRAPWDAPATAADPAGLTLAPVAPRRDDRVTVRFENLPAGARVTSDATGPGAPSLEVGYSFP